MNKFDLNNKNAIVTGGAQGFGLDIAKRFLQSGAKVILWDSDEKELEKASKLINDQNLSCDVVDVSDCLLYTSPSPRDGRISRMPSSA